MYKIRQSIKDKLFGKFANDAKYNYDKHMYITDHVEVIIKLLNEFQKYFKKSESILDIATGTGIIPIELHKMVPKA